MMQISSILSRQILRLWLAGITLLVLPLVGHAQETCSLGKVREHSTPIYPRIFDQRPTQGIVLLTATFAANGRVTSVKPISGPVFLKSAAATFVNSWQAEPSSELIRQCIVTVEYAIDGPAFTCEKNRDPEVSVERADAQHVTIQLHCRRD